MIVYTITANVTVGADAHIGPCVTYYEFAETDIRSLSYTARGDVGIAPYGSVVQIYTIIYLLTEPGEAPWRWITKHG